VTTVPMATPGFTQDAVVYINDYATTRDTITTSNSLKTGRAGVFRSTSVNVNGVYNNTIKNANHLTYSNFTAN
jgi:hypothetical protein